MGNWLRTSTRTAVMLAACILLSTSCGGGGGDYKPTPAGGVTVADLLGGWAGPTGVAALAGGPLTGGGLGGITTDGAGNATGTGVLSGIVGTIQVSNQDRGIFHFSGSGRSGMLMFSADPLLGGRYLTYLDDAGTFGAWQKDAAALAPGYTDGDVRDSAWRGLAATLQTDFLPDDIGGFTGGIDVAGNFATNEGTATQAMPVAITDPVLGHYQGDFLRPVPPPNTGVQQFLISPDLQFMAGLGCQGPPFLLPQTCLLTTWLRN